MSLLILFGGSKVASVTATSVVGGAGLISAKKVVPLSTSGLVGLGPFGGSIKKISLAGQLFTSAQPVGFAAKKGSWTGLTSLGLAPVITVKKKPTVVASQMVGQGPAVTAQKRIRVIGTASPSDVSNTLEGTNGVTISTANTAGPNQFDNVTLTGAGNAITFDTSQFYTGASSMFVNMGATLGTAYVAWTTSLTGTSVPSANARFYLRIPAAPGGVNRIASFQSGGSGSGHISITNGATPAVRLLNGAGATLITGLQTIPLNQWVRIELDVVGDSSVGSVTARLYLTPESASPTETIVSTGQNTTGAITAFRLGVTSNGGNTSSYYMDELAVGTSGPIGALTGSTVAMGLPVGIAAYSPVSRASTGAVAALQAFGSMASSLVIKKSISSGVGSASGVAVGVSRKVAPATAVGATEVTPLVVARKSAPATGLSSTGGSAFSTVKKIVKAAVAGAFGGSGSGIAKKVGVTSASGAAGSSATGLATKLVVAVARQVTGTAPIVLTTHVGRVFAAAETLASGLHQVLVKKVSTPVVNGATGTASIVSGKKVARPITAGTVGGVGSSLAQKKLPVIVVQAFGLSARGLTAGGSFIQASLALGLGAFNALVTKKTVATGAIATGVAESVAAKKVVGSTGTGVTGATPFATARKAAPALARAVAGLAPNAVTTHVGRVFAAAETLASGLHQVLVKKVSTPTVAGSVGGTSSSTSTKKAVVVARQVSGVATNAVTTHVGRVFAAAETLASGLHSVVARKVQGVSATGGAGVTSTGLTSSLRIVAAVVRGFLGVSPSALVKRINSVTGSAAVGDSPAVTAKKVTKTIAVAPVGTAASVNALKLVSAQMRALLGQAQMLSAKKAATPISSLTGGFVERVDAVKRSTPSVVQVLGVAPRLGAITKKAFISAFGGAGTSLGAIAQKKTTVSGQSTHGVSARGLTGSIQFAAITARSTMGVVVTAFAKKVATPFASGAGAAAPRVTAAKNSTVSVTASTGVVSRVTALKRTLASPSLVFSVVASVLARRKSAVNAIGSVGPASSATARKSVVVSGRSGVGASGTTQALSVRVASAIGALGGYLKVLVFAFIGQPPHIENGAVVVTNAETQVLVTSGLAEVVFLGGIADVIVNENVPEADLMVDLGNLIIGA